MAARLGVPALCFALLRTFLWTAAAGAALAPPDDGDVRRALTLLNFVGEEYREGVVDGQVVRPIEYEEAQAFLSEAQSRLRGAAPSTASASQAAFAALGAAVRDRVQLAQVQAQLEALRASISAATGVSEEVFPAAAPSAARGHALFTENCVACHGERADGTGPDAARLDPRPANFTDPTLMHRETPFDFFHVISIGRRGSAMPAWGEVLTLQDRWDLVSYLWTVLPGHAGLAEGQGVYVSACATCHGPAGDGRGTYASALIAPIPPLDTPAALARKSDDELLAAVAHGLPGTPMPGFSGRLSDAQMRAAVGYVRALSLGAGSVADAAASSDGEAMRFAGLLRVLGGEYQKAIVPGAAPNAQELIESEILLGQVQARWPRVQAALASRDAAVAPAVSAQLAQLADAVRDRRPAADVTALTGTVAQTIAAGFPSPAAAPARQDALAQAGQLLDDALTAYREHNPRAAYMVSDAYFLFDPLEQQLALADAALPRAVEGRFAELRGLMNAPGQDAGAAALVAALQADFERARAALAPRPSRSGVVLQSGLIILREGFEIVLVVGALLAYVAKIGSPAMRTAILWGTASGALASVLTAYALAEIFTAAGATADVLEGATMLLASAVLFFVSYWLISKAEAERWQRYIQGKVQSAVANGNVLALGSAAFLAVYREGTETVLFYTALIGSAGGDLVAVAAGFAGGAAALAVVYVLYQRLGKRLPLRQFFFATGALLYYLAVVFAGKGVAELQGAGWVRTTPVSWVPRIDALGLFPTVESLAVQGVLLLCVVYAVFVNLRGPRGDREPQRAVGVASHGGAKV